jgi:rod shape-determining protein MreB
MFGRMMDFLAKDMAMDLGTANTLIYVKGKGIVLYEPSMVATAKDSGEVIAIGREAKNLAGRHTRGSIITRPMRDGVIYDFEMASFMIRSFLGKVFRRFPLSRPKLVVAVPVGITSVEKRAVIEAADIAGAGKVFLIEEPMAAAIGAGLPIDQPSGQMVVDIGGGTTEVAIISKFAVSCSESLRVAGDEANEAICNFISQNHSMAISEMMAEVIKMKIGSAVPLKKSLEIKLRGKDLASGMPKVITVSDADIRVAMREPTLAIIEAVRRVLEKASPDLASDVAENGICLAGGCGLLLWLRALIHQVV